MLYRLGYLEGYFMLKIDSGICKGLKLQVSKEGTRPTLAKVRGSIMNSLQTELVQGARILDLFAGSGVMGIEAVSRGAQMAVFVENERSALKALDQNVESCMQRCANGGSEASLQIVRGDVEKSWNKLQSFGSFDIVFCDPPYADTQSHLPSLVTELSKVCCAGAIWVVEHERSRFQEEDLKIWEPMWSTKNTKSFGDTVLQFLQLNS